MGIIKSLLTNDQSIKNVPRLVIGAPQGRSGKTTFTLGLLRAFARQGLAVQPFKKGPDYIDASWHSAAAGKTCRNLDSFFMNKTQICSSILDQASDKQITIIEGAMGLYDGLDLQGSSSTAEIAKVTCTPVLFVVDATRMTRSIAAMVMGYQHFDPDVKIVGVVLNKVARARHEKVAREAIEEFCKIPVVGAIPKDANLCIPDRHLGLVTNGEYAETEKLLDYLADVISEHVDLTKIFALAQNAPELPSYSESIVLNSSPDLSFKNRSIRPKIGIIQDAAFSFYYQENIEILKRRADVVSISALLDNQLPDNLDALYIGGGFPEVFAQRLEANCLLRDEIRLAGEKGLPIYAECGGLMYLGRSIRTSTQNYEMVGLLPFDTQMEGKPQGHGYTIMETSPDQLWFPDKTQIRGHEFHNSRVINLAPNLKFGFKVKRGHGIDGQHDGLCYKNIFAAYNHIHALGCPEWAEGLINMAILYSNTRWSKAKKISG
ncbi:cobyrinate a,c-diamide synthase [Desulfosporosinus meridiei]|uniref:Cobyrinate a,c-diamide synthase n=1 Tax=Desulfosporosinus meridiei (strain ATCC BAA-275 / DSM 13257 / KCTC 12902 / NCIMB 13706 / S10) TaxID=768704 RepID=J7IS45_DESMD|nr:hydrogenobyrinic acid a, c-diamide synthase (glutamine-hydrolysing), cobyrinate a, c-diamide synthase [Desulfosporosinus meridiei DSM 13257]